jgi:hypothetical protein
MCAIGARMVADGGRRRAGRVVSPMMPGDVRDDPAAEKTAPRCCG